MKKTLHILGTAAVFSAAATAQTTLQLEVTGTQAGAQASTVYVLPGATVDYQVTGLLGGDASQGLCMFAFDASFDGGDLNQMAAPATGDIQQFVAPNGFNNPAGFGGTDSSGNLLQVGGAMNTIANQFAPTPSGIVVTGFADGGAALLAEGSLTAPAAAGSYTLSLSGGFANALESQDPTGFWRVRPVEVLDPIVLSVVVLDCGIQQYCTGKVNSGGCVATIQGSGTASLSGTGSLTLTVSDVVNDQFGLFVWGREEANMPLFGGTLCVAEPLMRILEPGTSGGTGPFGTNCSGSFTRTIDATFLASNGALLGETLYCQWFYRDRFAPDGTTAGLSEAARFSVCP